MDCLIIKNWLTLRWKHHFLQLAHHSWHYRLSFLFKTKV